MIRPAMYPSIALVLLFALTRQLSFFQESKSSHDIAILVDGTTHFSRPCRESPSTCCAFPVSIPAVLATAVFFQSPLPGVIEGKGTGKTHHFPSRAGSGTGGTQFVRSRWKNTGIAIMRKEGSWKSTAVAITPRERKFKWKNAGTEPAKRA